MLANHETGTWPKYTVRGEFSGFFATEPPDDFAEKLADYFAVTPNVALLTYSVDTDSCSAVFRSDLAEGRALEVGQELLNRAAPGILENFVASVADIGTGFVVPTIIDIIDKTKDTIDETKKGLSIAVPLMIALGAIVTVLVFRSEIKAVIGAR